MQTESIEPLAEYPGFVKVFTGNITSSNIKEYLKTKLLKGATKLYFTHYLFVIFILFSTGLRKSAFSTNSFGKLVFYRSVLFVFSVCFVPNLM